MTTGKNKIQFKEFYETITGGNYKVPYQNFMAYPPEMQIGVFIAYYDSVGMEIFISTNSKGKFGFHVDGTPYGSYKENTRPEAQTEALKKANELMNKQLNR
jgi:hypothetical protein